MTRRVIKKPHARQDLLDQFIYIGRRNLRAAKRFLVSAEETFLELAEMPGLGHPEPFANPRLSGLRSRLVIGFRNYRIFYRPLSDGIEVIRVLHGARDIDTIMESENPDRP